MCFIAEIFSFHLGQAFVCNVMLDDGNPYLPFLLVDNQIHVVMLSILCTHCTAGPCTRFLIFYIVAFNDER